MKKKIHIILIPFFLLSFILTLIMIIISSIITEYYSYSYNSFNKVKDTMTLSKNHKNIIYIMVDMTNGFDVTSILQSNKKIANNFTGFTNYLNLITNNWGTNAAILNIFGGYDYNPYYKNHDLNQNITFRNYMKNAMNVLISAFGKNKWEITAIANQYYHYNPKKSYWDSNWKTLEKDFQQYNLKAINANDISRLFYFQYPELYKDLKLPKKIFLKSSNVNFIPIISYLSKVEIKKTTTNKFMTIMDESNHGPIVMNQFGNYQNSSNTPENIYNSTKGFIYKINNFISYLKKNNIYDNTMIIINSDHGNNNAQSLTMTNKNFNFTGIDYKDIIEIDKKYPGIIRAFPTLLVKPFNSTDKIKYDNDYLYTNADALTFIKEYNKEINFKILDETKDIRYLKQLKDIVLRKNIYLPSYKNDSLWNDNFIHYLTPNNGWGGYSFLVKNNIYELKNYLVSNDTKDYYNPDELNHWKKII